MVQRVAGRLPCPGRITVSLQTSRHDGNRLPVASTNPHSPTAHREESDFWG
jgi:hypothetical protein